VYAVPKTVINEVGEVVGAVPEAQLVAALTDALRHQAARSADPPGGPSA
jgi:predicted DsbA family dithiol-disulfide isomerase